MRQLYFNKQKIMECPKNMDGRCSKQMYRKEKSDQ